MERKNEPRYVLTECIGCGNIQWQYLSNLQNGKSKRMPKMFTAKKDSLMARPQTDSGKSRDAKIQTMQAITIYGEHGIRFSFPNVTEAGLYLIRTYGLPDREMEIDRINNDMDYAPGNLRFVSHAENNGTSDVRF